MMKPIRTLMDGARGAAGVLVGKVASRAIPANIGLPTTGTTGIAVQAAIAIVLAMVADKVSKRDAPFIVAGALLAPLEAVVRGANIPIISASLSAYPEIGMGAYPLGAFPGAGMPLDLDLDYEEEDALFL